MNGPVSGGYTVGVNLSVYTHTHDHTRMSEYMDVLFYWQSSSCPSSRKHTTQTLLLTTRYHAMEAVFYDIDKWWLALL